MLTKILDERKGGDVTVAYDIACKLKAHLQVITFYGLKLYGPEVLEIACHISFACTRPFFQTDMNTA